MKRAAFLAQLLTTVVLLLLALVPVACESLIVKTGVTATSLSQSATSTVATTSEAAEALLEDTSSTVVSAQAYPPSGTTTTTLYTVVTGLWIPVTLPMTPINPAVLPTD